MKQTSDGGYILGGTSVSNFSGNKTENCIGGNDYWIVKTDSIGNIQWQNTIGGILNDNLTSVMQTADGGFILGGYSESYIFGDKTENCLGDFDYWIVKTDSLGNIQWQNTIGGILEDELFALQQTADGGYILGGKSRSDISGDKTENSQGGYDYWIVKTDSIGNIQWQNTIGGSINDELNSIHQTADGGFILGGFSGSGISGDKTENCLGGYDYWIVKTDSQGNIQWQNTLGGSVNDFMYSVRQTADGGYVLGGNSNSNISGDKSENCLGFDDFWIVKTDVAGNIEWQNTIGGSFIDWMSSVQQTNDGGYILSGSSASNISVDKTENSLGDIDYWVVKLDTAGYIQWQNTIGGSNADRLTSVLETTDGAYVLGGWSWSDISGDKTENCYVLEDFWVVKIRDQYNLIKGQLFSDSNNNSIHDSGEPQLANQKITEQGSNSVCFSDQNGNYSLFVLDTGNFIASPPSINWYNPAPVSHTATFTGIHQTDSLNDFAFQSQGAFEDGSITITPISNFRSGFTAYYQIKYSNYGTTNISPSVYFYPYSNVTFQSSTVTPSQISPDSVIWNLSPMTPFQTGSIIITVNVNSGLPIGTLINSSAHIEPYATDANQG
ncbi:MAG: hypothetical protein IPN36_16300, partial [Bacteroidetes bacterium]|nr:hypothetical protein [Bacteroidota bacterium]